MHFSQRRSGNLDCSRAEPSPPSPWVFPRSRGPTCISAEGCLWVRCAVRFPYLLAYQSFIDFHLIFPISNIIQNSIYTTAKSFNCSQGGSPVGSASRMRHLASTSGICWCWSVLFKMNTNHCFLPLTLHHKYWMSEHHLLPQTSAVAEFTDGRLNLWRLNYGTHSHLRGQAYKTVLTLDPRH